MLWILLSLLSALWTTFRYLYIKKYCVETPPELLVFYTRLTGGVLYLGITVFQPVAIHRIYIFVPVVLLTVFITAIATVLQIREIQRSRLNTTIPYLTFIPVFMVPWTWIFFHQVPSMVGAAGILIVCAGAYILNTRQTDSLFKLLIQPFRKGQGRTMLIVALSLGLTTVCDKLAIDASSAFSYALIWSCTSAMVMGIFISWKRHSTGFSGHALVQACFWAGAFLCQMLAVEQVRIVQSGVTYVKLLTMLNILLTVIIGGRLFKEEHYKRCVLAAGFMVAGEIIVVLAGV